MDGDEQLNVHYLDPVAIMDRFIGQPNFAGKTYLKFERQKSKERIRRESKLPISESPAHRHAQRPIAAFTSGGKGVQTWAKPSKLSKPIFGPKSQLSKLAKGIQ